MGKIRMYMGAFRVWMALILFLSPGSFMMAQSTRVYVGLGSKYDAFQDARFSDLQLTAFGPALELGFRYLDDRSFILVAADGFGYFTTQPGTAEDQVNCLDLNLRAGYLHSLIPGLYLGGTWDILDYVTRNQSELSNGSNFFHTASDLFASGKYLFRAGDNWSFEFGLDLGLISFTKYAPSFTANLEQKAIDQGEASFQDLSVRSPFALKHVNIKPIGKQLVVRTHAEVFFRRRLSMAYTWNMRTFADQKGYPLTMANHSLTLRIHFISRPK
jgi:hypothetical protein